MFSLRDLQSSSDIPEKQMILRFVPMLAVVDRGRTGRLMVFEVTGGSVIAEGAILLVPASDLMLFVY